MNLSEQDGRQFYDLLAALLERVNSRYRCVPEFSGAEQYCALPGSGRLEVRNALYEHPECFDDFLEAGNSSILEDGPDLVRGWRDHRVSGDFYVMRHLRAHSLFLTTQQPHRAYGVVGLAERLEDMLPLLPAMVGAVLLPFRGRIVYDGLLTGLGVGLRFGAGIRRTLEETLRSARASGGVICSLPLAASNAQADLAVAERKLAVLVRSEHSREANWGEIRQLRARSSRMERVYHQERGKADARRAGKALRDRGIERGWFALYEGMLIAGATTRSGLADLLHELLPPAVADLPYLYQLGSGSSGRRKGGRRGSPEV